MNGSMSNKMDMTVFRNSMAILHASRALTFKYWLGTAFTMAGSHMLTYQLQQIPMMMMMTFSEVFWQNIWGLCRQKQVSQAWISNCISQNTVGCNYLSLPEIPASGIKVLIWYNQSNWKIIPQQCIQSFAASTLLVIQTIFRPGSYFTQTFYSEFTYGGNNI